MLYIYKYTTEKFVPILDASSADIQTCITALAAQCQPTLWSHRQQIRTYILYAHGGKIQNDKSSRKATSLV